MFRYLLRDLRGSSAARSLWVFCACLFLGIALIAACGGLLQQIRGGLEGQQRNLFGGDLELRDRTPINERQRVWLNSRGTVSGLIELRTMLAAPSGEFAVVELQSVDQNYPLYGQVALTPSQSLTAAVGQSSDGVWGAAFDPLLAEQLGLAVGQRVRVGALELELRALIEEQPDRSLRADWRGPPLIIHRRALEATGLMQPGSLIDYRYRVRTDEDPDRWRRDLGEAFPDAKWEVQTVSERGEVLGDRLNQVASVLLLIGFSTLLIGGMGVANSVGAYLQSKLRTLATLQSLGARSAQVAGVYVGQIVVLAAMASAAGAICGAVVAWSGAQALADRLPISAGPGSLLFPTLMAIVFGIVNALVFALPILGRTLDMPPLRLLRGDSQPVGKTPRLFRIATAVMVALALGLLFAIVPEPLIGLAFIGCIAALFLFLDGIVVLVRTAARKLGRLRWLDGRFVWRAALANLYRPGTALRPMLLSLGMALTLLVAASLVIAATLRALNETVPERTPALVFYDIPAAAVDDFTRRVQGLEGFQDLVIAPLVLGRLSSVNGEVLASSGDAARALEANDEHKLSHRFNGIDNTRVERGAWWPDGYQGPPLVAMEDREADQLGLVVGDRLRFTILGQTVDAELVAIYGQARFETRFWLEGVFSDGALTPFITRYIGSAFMREGAEIPAMRTLGEAFPSVVTLRTAKVLDAARSILTAASLAVALIAAISLAASVLVMASVVAVNRQRQVYEASVLHAVGTRMSDVLRSVLYEYALLAGVLSIFATLVGSLIAWGILVYWIELPTDGVWVIGLVVATAASTSCLLAGAWWLVRTLAASPADLLRRGA